MLCLLHDAYCFVKGDPHSDILLYQWSRSGFIKSDILQLDYNGRLAISIVDNW